MLIGLQAGSALMPPHTTSLSGELRIAIGEATMRRCAHTRYHFPAAYTCGLFNNQPMGFYSPETLLNDARRHGVKILPIDVQHSDWHCTLEALTVADQDRYTEPLAVRIGLRYVRGLREEVGKTIADTRLLDGEFDSEYDLKRRVSAIRKSELVLLAKVGAFNWTGKKHHRRTSLWYTERAGQGVGPLFEQIPNEQEMEASTPLRAMTAEERLIADFNGIGMTIGPQLMAYHRAEMDRRKVVPASELSKTPDGAYARIAGVVIARQRPGTAAGFVFLSLEDETGISRAIVDPYVYERNRLSITHGKILQVEGILQNQDNVVTLKASIVQVLNLTDSSQRSHDFH